MTSNSLFSKQEEMESFQLSIIYFKIKKKPLSKVNNIFSQNKRPTVHIGVLLHTWIGTLLSRATRAASVVCAVSFGAKKQTVHSISYYCVILIILAMTCQPQLSMHRQCITSIIYA